MPAYGKVKVDTITYDLSGTATDVSVSNIATKSSPTFTGTVTVPTASANDNTTKAASTAYVQTELGDYALKAGPTFTGTINAASLVLSADLTVNGTTTTINTTTLQVEDKNIEIGKVSTPSDATADGGGLTLLGATNKTWNWVNSTDAWTSSEHIHLIDNKKLFVGGASGTTDGLEIVHNASDSILNDTGTGALKLQLGGSTKLEIQSGGINVTGVINVNGSALSAAPTITGTMSGSVAQDKPVQVKSDGTLEAVFQTNAGAGTTAFIDNGSSGGFDQVSRSAPLGGGKFATIYINSSNHAECCITEVNPTTQAVTKGSTTVLNTSATTNFPSVCYDNVNDRIVYSYMLTVNGTHTLFGKVATVSGTTQTFGSEVSVQANAYHADICFDPENSTVVWAYEVTGGKIYCNTAKTTSSRSLTIGSTSVEATGGVVTTGNQPTLRSIRLQNCVGKVGMLFRDASGGNIWYKAMSVGNNSISSAGNNAWQVFTSLGSKDVGLGFARTQQIAGSANNSGNFAIATVLSDVASPILYARTFTIGSNGEKGSDYGGVATLSTGGVTQDHGTMHLPFDMNLGKWVYISKYSPASGSDYLAWQGLAPDLTQSWTPTITAPTQINATTDAQEVDAVNSQIEGSNNTGTPIDPVSSTNRIHCVFRDNADSDKINHLGLLTTNVTNLTTSVVGFADAAYTNGQTATIKVNSNTTTQSSLTPGTEYFVQGDASLGTSAHSEATVKAGIALTSTSLLIKG